MNAYSQSVDDRFGSITNSILVINLIIKSTILASLCAGSIIVKYVCVFVSYPIIWCLCNCPVNFDLFLYFIHIVFLFYSSIMALPFCCSPFFGVCGILVYVSFLFHFCFICVCVFCNLIGTPNHRHHHRHCR